MGDILKKLCDKEQLDKDGRDYSEMSGLPFFNKGLRVF
jgi:hypothetical protein